LPFVPRLVRLEYLLVQLVRIEPCFSQNIPPLFVDLQNFSFKLLLFVLELELNLLLLLFVVVSLRRRQGMFTTVSICVTDGITTWSWTLSLFGFNAGLCLKVFVIKHQDRFHLDKPAFKLFLLLEQLFDELILSLNLFFEHLYNIVLAFEHV
jgi:hypothetical protein